MIFYHNQLMKSPRQLQLFLVSHPVPPERYEDHEAALYLQLHTWIEQAKAENENPVALIESYLATTYRMGDDPDEIVAFLFQTGELQSALRTLETHWHHLDASLPGDSLVYGGVSSEEVTRTYAEMNLRTFLEALVAQQNESS